MDNLGISAFYHDSAACLVRDGRILAAVTNMLQHVQKVPPALYVAGDASEHGLAFPFCVPDDLVPVFIGNLIQQLPGFLITPHPKPDFRQQFSGDVFHTGASSLALPHAPGQVPMSFGFRTPAIRLTTALIHSYDAGPQKSGRVEQLSQTGKGTTLSFWLNRSR